MRHDYICDSAVAMMRYRALTRRRASLMSAKALPLIRSVLGVFMKLSALALERSEIREQRALIGPGLRFRLRSLSYGGQIAPSGLRTSKEKGPIAIGDRAFLFCETDEPAQAASETAAALSTSSVPIRKSRQPRKLRRARLKSMPVET